MSAPIYIVVGVPASGKSWVCDQLKEEYCYIPHDKYMHSQNAYIGAAISSANTQDKPVLIETPFSLSQIMGPLEKHRFRLHPVFILEHPDTLKERYWRRERKDYPPGHLTRQHTYEERAYFYDAFIGNSSDVLKYLKSKTEVT